MSLPEGRGSCCQSHCEDLRQNQHWTPNYLHVSCSEGVEQGFGSHTACANIRLLTCSVAATVCLLRCCARCWSDKGQCSTGLGPGHKPKQHHLLREHSEGKVTGNRLQHQRDGEDGFSVCLGTTFWLESTDLTIEGRVMAEVVVSQESLAKGPVNNTGCLSDAWVKYLTHQETSAFSRRSADQTLLPLQFVLVWRPHCSRQHPLTVLHP